MRSQELLGDSGPIGETGRERLLATREALREMLLANNTGVPAPPAALATINREAQDAPLGLRFEADQAELVCAGTGVDRAIAQLLALVYEARWDGTWSRLKVCPAEDCRWAFYDRSRNRAATWCEMGECGNRSKARAIGPAIATTPSSCTRP